MSESLNGQVVLITGGGTGIGRAIAEELSASGASVAVTSRNIDRLKGVAKAVEAAGGTIFKVGCDITSQQSVRAAIEDTERELGPITFLVNNAGRAGPFGPIGEVDPEEWWAAMEVHIRAPMLFVSNLIPKMRARGKGRILNICSKGGLLISKSFSAYCLGKCAEIRLTEFVDLENKAFGVRAFAVHPGNIITEMARETMHSPDARRHLPWMIDAIEQISHDQSSFRLSRCVRYVAEIAAGKHDDLAGRYVDFDENLDMLKEQYRDREIA